MIDSIQFQQMFPGHLPWTPRFWLSPRGSSHSQKVLKAADLSLPLFQTVSSPQPCVQWPISTDNQLVSMIVNIKTQHLWSLTWHITQDSVWLWGWKTRQLSSRNLHSARGTVGPSRDQLWCLFWVSCVGDAMAPAWQFREVSGILQGEYNWVR